MSDQQPQDQKPVLTPEEELDVLEAVWRIGKEKGLEMLRPEQVKKLIDVGRIQPEVRRELGVQSEKKLDVYKILPTLVAELLADIPDDFQASIPLEQWKKLSDRENSRLKEVLFKMKYGLFPDYFEYYLKTLGQ